MPTATTSIALTASLLASGLIATTASAGSFDTGIPSGWPCSGTCGVSAADGVVPLAPGGGTKYGWIATTGSEVQTGLPGLGGMDISFNGSTLRTASFDAAPGARLAFQFNYTTSDGADYADYAWARLLDNSNNQIALLMTARTGADGKAVPGFDMPAAAAALTPPTVSVIPGATRWSPLGGRSDDCYDTGCGSTGWVDAAYTIAASGRYRVEFGVTNWNDADFDSGLAFDAVTLDGAALPVPEPASYGMLLAGMALLGATAKRRNKR